ncbi:MAG: hypothetical protein II312_04510 [Lachnospiraceae bacterium]|nr:hypothetical protein [Lachnospiraceae bacterium]
MVRDALRSMLENNGDSSRVIRSSWIGKEFLKDKLSAHQKGTAIDVSLVRVDSIQKFYSGDYDYIKVTEYLEYKGKTAIYEWRNNISEIDEDKEVCRLCEYLSEAGMEPVSLEWWHFNDLANAEEINNADASGQFYLKDYFGAVP